MEEVSLDAYCRGVENKAGIDFARQHELVNIVKVAIFARCDATPGGNPERYVLHELYKRGAVVEFAETVAREIWEALNEHSVAQVSDAAASVALGSVN
jgi:hypothetical protein